MSEGPQVIVIGAGAAGLAAARLLSRRRVRCVVLEARDRLGGRIASRELAGLAAPIELGAEFVHGRPQITYDLLREAGTTTLDVSEGHWERDGDCLREAAGSFESAAQLLERAGAITGDISVEEFLRRCSAEGGLEDRIRRLRWLVQGFDAADPSRASLRAIAEEWSGPTMAGSQARPLGGYAPLLRALVRSIDPACVAIRTQSSVEELRWKRGLVTVAGRTRGVRFELSAPRAILSLPIGVLAQLRFTPPLGEDKRGALGSLAMGPVVKVVMCFRTRWWERLHGEAYERAAFFHRFDADFPTFWTQLPIRAPMLTAWAGGPVAARLTGKGEDEIVRRATSALQSTFGDPPEIASELEAAFVADWSADPYALGAYSYVLVDGSGARRRLASPLDDTLFFAGEATSSDASGTVSGALESGERAAQQVFAPA